jgi:REP element-mobilizing transposase RayT
MGFKEEILCGLNRSIQDKNKGFECHAFKPDLKPVVSLVSESKVLSNDQTNKNASVNLEVLLNSDKFKYQRALSVQRLEQDPDAVYVEIKYHLVWNLISRRQVFVNPSDAVNIFNDALPICNKFIGGFVSLLWLAPDHIHLYIESDGEKSVDAIIRYLKRASAKALYKTKGNLNGGIWDKGYFVETLG